ncbi:type II secretion system F family protein [Actinokineospora xionganensis]|uniref:Type II secretion system F family protein n=1 Tax=Actinokineospora xionganensis TaxID=2684470 RepID=A0ABR7L3C9_9PSEU|nr:type II secretion system F family protein [Actinokineospora xionganensis]MBC6447008.1 type II secretion system F family protein [Actinokineospora xionganensis]
MLIPPVLLLAAAVLAWPSDVASLRLRRLTVCQRPTLLRKPKHVGPIAALAAALVCAAMAGVGGGVAAAMATLTVGHHVRDRRRVRSVLAATAGLAEAIRSLVAELRAGAHPADAAEGAARDADPTVAATLRAAASALRLGGDIDDAFNAAGPEATVARAWRLAARHGLPLADVLDAVRAELDHQVGFARQVIARMAGPRAGAMVLAGLPVIGLLLGQAMGAAPLGVLTNSFGGQVLLVAGVALECAGVLWSAWLTNRVVAP